MDTTFVGRRPELAEVGLLLKRSRLVTLTGAGGVGKTRLARRALGDAARIPVDLTVLVDLEPLDEPEALPHAVARSLGLEEDPARPAVEAMAAWFSPRDVLLVLDTCDQLVDAVAELAAALLRAVPNLRILTTGRQALGVPGEHVYLVRPMRLDDAVTLLRERLTHPVTHPVTDSVTDPVSDPATDPVTDAEAAEVCELLDRLPLAIELAARRLPGGSARELIGELRERGELPAQPAADAAADRPRRHHSMRAAIGWSHGLCTPRERLLWARASVFGADFDLEAAEFVCSGGPLPAAAVLDTIGGLVEKSVLFTCDHPGGARYRMLGGVRRFGACWLDLLGERAAVQRRHDDYLQWLDERGTQ